MASLIIPLFPLNIVLFPGMVLPLRIFEPRYRLMVRRCLDGDRQFGVALIKEGEEVGGYAEACTTGTLAEVSGCEMLPDGQIMLVCVGVRRFNIQRRVTGEPYAQAEIELLDEGDPADPVDDALVDRAATTLDSYLKALASLTNLSVSMPSEKLSPIDLSYLCAATLQVDNQKKQELLEAPDTAARLARGLDLLEHENGEIQHFLEKCRTKGDYFYRGFRMSVN